MVLSLRKQVVLKEFIYLFRGRERENSLIALQSVLRPERKNTAFQSLVARQSTNGKISDRTEFWGQSTPPTAIMDTQMSFVSPKQFFLPLPNQRNFTVLAHPPGDKIHRNDGRSCNRLLQTLNNP